MVVAKANNTHSALHATGFVVAKNFQQLWFILPISLGLKNLPE
jgi:hypothetical protein